MPNPATRMNENRVNVPFAYIDAATAYTDQTVTFTVKDNAESSPNAIAGAAVNVNGSIRLTALTAPPCSTCAPVNIPTASRQTVTARRPAP